MTIPKVTTVTANGLTILSRHAGPGYSTTG